MFRDILVNIVQFYAKFIDYFLNIFVSGLNYYDMEVFFTQLSINCVVIGGFMLLTYLFIRKFLNKKPTLQFSIFMLMLTMLSLIMSLTTQYLKDSYIVCEYRNSEIIDSVGTKINVQFEYCKDRQIGSKMFSDYIRKD